ncbi:TolC family protein [Pseudopedobacter beijingensis]|uniref:TolC family protein n=1 Tax=Pseudopedobacter beijingensis TaxID=1207056 RepID=A0ABW4IDC3_9SPHI
MKNISLLALFVGSCVVSVPSRAQDVLGLKEVWGKVENNYPGIQFKDAHIQSLKIDSVLLISKYLPKVNAQFQNSYSTYTGTNGAFYPQAGLFNVSGSATSINGVDETFNAFGSVVGSWDVFQFGKKSIEKNIANLEIKKSYEDYASYILALKADVTRRYLEQVYQYESLGWSTQNINRLQEILEITKTLAISGLKPTADTLLAASAYQLVLADKDAVQSNYLASDYYLKLYLGTVNDEPLELEKAAFLKGFQGNVLYTDSAFVNPALKYQQLHQEGFLLKKKNSNRSLFPSLALLGGFSTRSVGIYPNGFVSNSWKNGFDNIANNYMVGLGLRWDITNLYVGKKEAKKYQALELSAAKAYDEVKLKDETSRKASLAQLNELRRQLEKSKLSVEQAREAYEMYFTRYESGLMNLTELLQIQGQLQQTEKAYLDASKKYWFQVVVFAQLNGDFNNLFDKF